MPPTDRFVPRFAAEPPQDLLPYGRWAERLSEHFLAACTEVEPEEGDEIGEPGEITWFPDRTWSGWTYVPASARTSTGLELFGYVQFSQTEEGEEPEDFDASADYTTETVDRNPDWMFDISDEAVDSWRGEQGAAATVRLVWGIPQVSGGVVATAELAGVTVDQCSLLDGRFTLLAPDDYRGDSLEVALFDKRGGEVARESLFEEDDEEEEGE